MLNKKISKVGVTALLLLAVLGTLKTKSQAAQLECTKITDDKVKYVDVSMWDFNPEHYNAMMRGFSPEVYYPQAIDKRSEYDKQALLFGSTEGMNVGGIQNGYIGVNKYRKCNGVIQGLAENKLNNGQLNIISQYKNGNSLFPKNGEGSDEYLSNWKFPFLKEENGYYSFNSDEYHVEREYNSKKFNLHKGARNGFYPFNTCQQNTFDNKNKDLYFTAKFEIPFIMTEDGKIRNTKTGKLEDMIFNFSGDDDVWIFIDNDLVVDLGGVHIKQTGNLNLAENTVKYSCVYNKEADVDNFNVTQKALNGGRLSKGSHTLKVFYMERAGGESNLFVNFNLQSSGVKVNHIEKGTNKILKEEIFTGPVGSKITTSSKEFENHRLKEKPENENIELKEDLQTVNYYYEINHNLNVDYVDILSNNKIAESETSKLYENENYEKKPKEIRDYIFIKDSGNTSGKMGNEDKKITFYYKYANSKVKANYIDKTTNKKMYENTRIGIEGEKFTFEEKKFDNYVLVEKPKSNEVTFTKKDQELNYYYKAKGKVTVNYIDNATKKNLGTEVKGGIEGDKVKTQAKKFDNYILYKSPEKEEYILNRDDIQVNYYYLHQSKITVNYIDKDENKNLDQENSIGTEGMIFESKEKQFENYKLVKSPENTNVIVGKDDIVIDYYYEKLKFNLKVTMNLKQATINSHYYSLKGKIGKVETEIREANPSSSVKIYYNVKVENTEERTGSGIISVELPEGYIARQEDNLNWNVNDGKVTIDVDDMKAKEERNFELVLIKTSNDDISKTVRNTVKVESKGIEEVNLDDNTDYNDLVIMPRTGIRKKICYIIIFSSALVTIIFALDKKFKIRFTPLHKNKK